MFISRIILKNWRNFKEADTELRDVTYVLGANATGKSNFLDVFRFLRDIAKPQGGGLQKAISDRGGLTKLRCLHARRDPEVAIEIQLVEQIGDPHAVWRYQLAFKSEGAGANRPVVASEVVYHFDGKKESRVLLRPTAEDSQDR